MVLSHNTMCLIKFGHFRVGFSVLTLTPPNQETCDNGLRLYLLHVISVVYR